MPTLSTLKRGGELLWSNHKLRIRGQTKEQQAKAANSRGREQGPRVPAPRSQIAKQTGPLLHTPRPLPSGGREWDAPPLAIGAPGRGPRTAAANETPSDAFRSAPAWKSILRRQHHSAEALLCWEKSASLAPLPAAAFSLCGVAKWKTLSLR